MTEQARHCPCCGQRLAAADDRLRLDMDANVAMRRGRLVRLTPREAEVLAVLQRRMPEVVPAQQIAREVFGALACQGIEEPELRIRECVFRLRQKLGQIGVRVVGKGGAGGGYRLVVS